MGTSVESGTATAVVVTTGVQTYLGSMAHLITGGTSADELRPGPHRFTWLMIQFMAGWCPWFFSSTFYPSTTGRELSSSPWRARRLTPEMLPYGCVRLPLHGALAMSRKKVIVKRLNSIQNFGAWSAVHGQDG